MADDGPVRALPALRIEVLSGDRGVKFPYGSSYAFAEQLGEGSFGKVFLAYHSKHPYTPVVAKVPVERVGASESLRREAGTLLSIHHRSVVSYREYVDAAEVQLLVMDYAEGGDLAQVIKSRRVSLIEAARILLGVLQVEALEHLRVHDRAAHIQVVHGDIKPSNILLSRSGDALLADFGLGHTPVYAAPEVLRVGSPPPTTKADLWSVGVVMVELLTGSTMGTQAFDVERPGWALPAFPDATPAFFAALVQGMLVVDPDRRLGCAELLTSSAMLELKAYIDQPPPAEQLPHSPFPNFVKIRGGECKAHLLSVRLEPKLEAFFFDEKHRRRDVDELSGPTITLQGALSNGCPYDVTVVRSEFDGPVAYRKQVFPGETIGLDELLATYNRAVDEDWVCWWCKFPSSVGTSKVCTFCLANRADLPLIGLSFVPVANIPVLIAMSVLDCGRAASLRRRDGEAAGQAASIRAGLTVVSTAINLFSVIPFVSGGVRLLSALANIPQNADLMRSITAGTDLAVRLVGLFPATRQDHGLYTEATEAARLRELASHMALLCHFDIVPSKRRENEYLTDAAARATHQITVLTEQLKALRERRRIAAAAAALPLAAPQAEPA